MSTDDARIERNAMRWLAAAYRLAKGRTDVPVDRSEVQVEVERERLFELSDEEFVAYRAKAVAEVKEWRRRNQS